MLPIPESSALSETPSSTLRIAANDLARRWRRIARTRNLFLVGWLGGITVEILWFIGTGVVYRGPLPHPASEIFLSVLVGLTACWFGSCLVLLGVGKQLEDFIGKALAHNDLNATGCWIDLVCRPPFVSGSHSNTEKWKKRREGVRVALLENLRRWPEDRIDILSAGERQMLYRALEKNDRELIAAILLALPFFGDARAFPSVRTLAQGKGAAAEDAALQQAAQVCLERLQAHIARRNSPQTLLRASKRPAAPAEELLRTVQNSVSVPAEQLLRAETPSNTNHPANSANLTS